MKDFLKNVGATVVGIILFFVITGLLGMMCIIGMVAAGSSAKEVKDNSVMVLNLSGQLEERSEETILT